jgi:MFS transporter, putative metabolite:H+ symporter
MAVSEGNEPGAGVSAATRESLTARLDRIHVWSLSYLFIAVIGLGFFFTFYDIFDINVSFIQTCVQIQPGCTAPNAVGFLTLPVFLNLVGYVVGTLILSPVSDRIGRRNMLMLTMLITGLGSLYSALAHDYGNFVASRFITGIGIGADLAVVNTYINEVSPRTSRARFASVIFIMSALGALVGIWLGVFLTTEPAPWPAGLPFALAGPGFSGSGWRWMYYIGAALALVAILLRYQLPESPRWLIGRHKLTEAARLVEDMERLATRRAGALPPPREHELPSLAAAGQAAESSSYLLIFRDPRYVRRALLLFVVWFTGYVTVYSYAAGFTSLLTALHYTPPEAGTIAGVGGLGYVASSTFASVFAERLERKLWLPVSAVICVIAGVIIAAAGTNFAVACLGACILFFGFNLWVSPTYAWSAENFPSRARATGFALVDGLGHLGGAVGILIIAATVINLNIYEAFFVINAFLVFAAIVAQFGIRTRNRSLEDLSPE